MIRFLNATAVLMVASSPLAAGNDLAPPTINMSNLPPKLSDSIPLEVYVGLYFESLSSFQANQMSYDVDAYLYLSWMDTRLAHNQSDHKLGDEMVKVNFFIHYFFFFCMLLVINRKDELDKIWLPDLYFANARSASFQDVIVPNFSMFVSRNGTVAFSTRVMLTVACNLDLARYPHDEQKCGLKIQSYTYTRDQVKVTWFSWRPVRFNDYINLPEFKIIHMGAESCSGVYNYAITEYSHKEGHFSCLLATLHLSRSVGYHFWQTYLPTGMIVVISWVSFWIDPGAVPARVSLSFTTLLTLSTMGAGLRYAVPPVSYAKSIDLWFGTCMMFVFAALLEYAAVNSYMRQANKAKVGADAGVKRMGASASIVFGGSKGGAADSNAGKRTVLAGGDKLAATTDGRTNGASPNKVRLSAEPDDKDDANRDALLQAGDRPPAPNPARAAKYMRIALNIDKTSRVAFPGAFTLFLILYIVFLTKLF